SSARSELMTPAEEARYRKSATIPNVDCAPHTRKLGTSAETYQLRIRTFLDDCEEAHQIVLTHKRMRVARLAIRQCTNLLQSHVIPRMDRQVHVRAGLIRDV